jgi:hypothetical protein
MRRPRKPPSGYVFTREEYRWYWRPTPHYHVNESSFGDVDGRAFTSEEEAKRVLWRIFRRDYDYEDIIEYRHRPQDGTIEITYPEDHQPCEIELGLLLCESDDDCYMVEEGSAGGAA